MSVFDFRDRGYTVLSRLEPLLRSFVEGKMKQTYGPGWASRIPRRDRALSRVGGDTIHVMEGIDFIDLNTMVTDQQHGDWLGQTDPALIDSLFTELYSLRNRIDHVRFAFTAYDLNRVVELSTALVDALDIRDTAFAAFIGRVRLGSDADVRKAPLTGSPESVMSNIPEPDYSIDGGFVGRREDLRKVRALLSSDLYRVVSVTGGGGVGKSAAALELCIGMALEPEPQFDIILWTSAKEDRLGFTGIEHIVPTLTQYESLLDQMVSVVSLDPSELKTIADKEAFVMDILKSYRMLLVIDNLETIHDQRILDFIVSFPPPGKVLITSRRGLGEVERRYPLDAMGAQEAKALFRVVAHERRVKSLADLPDSSVDELTARVCHYPLAIKWAIGQVSRGIPVEEAFWKVTAPGSQVAKFCFDAIFDSYSEDERLVLFALSCLDEAPTRGIIYHLTEIPEDKLSDALSGLLLTSLVVPEHINSQGNKAESRFRLHPLAREFVTGKLDERPDVKSTIGTRLARMGYLLEQADIAVQGYYSAFTPLNNEQKIAMIMVQNATHAFQAGRYPEAVTILQQAQNIAPDFGWLYLRWATIEDDAGHPQAADKLMERAAQLMPKNADVWLAWGNMLRKRSKTGDAAVKLKQALALSPTNPYVMNSLGWAECFLGHLDEAEEHFRKALQSDDGQRAVNVYGLAEVFRRKAQVDADHELQLLSEADRLLNEVMLSGDADTRVLQLQRRVVLDEAVAVAKRQGMGQAETLFKRALAPDSHTFRDSEQNARTYWLWARQWLRRDSLSKARTLCDEALRHVPKSSSLLSKIQETVAQIEARAGLREVGVAHPLPAKAPRPVDSRERPQRT